MADKLPPAISCPADVTIACFLDGKDLGITGQATAIDNCDNAPIIQYDDSEPITGCGNQTIVRTWTAIDASGNSSICTQNITIQSGPTFTLGQINWPDDLVTMDCEASISNLVPDSLSSPNDFPQIIIDFCQSIEVTYDDDVFTFCGGAFKILRTWSVLDECTGSLFQHIQVINKTCTYPVAVCFANVTTILGIDGTATLLAIDLDGGSYDDCGNPLEFRIKRSDGFTGVPSTTSLTLNCDDVGTQIIEMWVGNGTGGWNECWTELELLDVNQACPDPGTLREGETTTRGRDRINDIKIYPNPTSDILNVQVNIIDPSTAFIRLYDISGRLIMQKSNLNSGYANYQLSLDQLNVQGVLLLSVFDGLQLTTHKVFKTE